ncbi:MAG: nuclear transport factor 2 family protein [Novosphingobium sp.]|nr:nuclear transport factor 2 family protein [Novosphingobium sp.]
MTDIVELMQAWLNVFAEGEFEKFPGAVSDDFTLYLPFVPPGVPTEIRGRDTVQAKLKETSGGRSKLLFDNVHIMRTEDPEVVVTRASGEATMANGNVYRNSYVMFTRFREGEVLEHTEYLNPLNVIASMQAPA